MPLPTKKIVHRSADASHYNKEAEYYDGFNEANSKIINETLEKILSKKKVKTVLDLACGTGSQAFWLMKKGYKVSAYDINAKMLRIASKKAKQKGLNITFSKGDMRSTKAGQFDAVITLFNAIGHLTRADFKKAIRNSYENLIKGGVYLFDIFNLNYLLHKDNITKLTIDWQIKCPDKIVREMQYSLVDKEGILVSYDIYFEQKNSGRQKIIYAYQTLQVYSANELKAMLRDCGFRVVHQCGIDGSRLREARTKRVLTIAEKV